MSSEDTPTVTKPNFGAWLKTRLDERKIKYTAVSAASGIAYPNLSAILNSGKDGAKPIQPEELTMRRLVPVLMDLGVIDDADEAWVAAGYLPEGYKVVKETDSFGYSLEPPENFADWPQELQEALAYTQDLDTETQKYIYGLWRLQASAHHDITLRTREARRQLEEREERLRAEKTDKDH